MPTNASKMKQPSRVTGSTSSEMAYVTELIKEIATSLDHRDLVELAQWYRARNQAIEEIKNQPFFRR